MVTQAQIDRINELARKAKTPEGLTEDEQAERAVLRRAYIDSFKESLVGQLENTYIVRPDGTKEKVQLILVMSRNADLYILDEPIAGVDPAAREDILRTIINNYNPEATVLISTHLISDVEQVLDEVVFMKYGQLVLYSSVDNIREEHGKSVDAYFREVFAC